MFILLTAPLARYANLINELTNEQTRGNDREEPRRVHENKIYERELAFEHAR